MICALFAFALSNAQPLVDQEDVSALLAEIESQGETRAIYGVNSKKKIAEIPFSSGFKLVRREGDWSIVRFNQATVPGWVSQDYVSIYQGRATVRPDALNLRLRPSLNSGVMMSVNAGYSSEIIGIKNGFVRIYAPRSLEVAIRSGDRPVAIEKPTRVKSAPRSKWVSGGAEVKKRPQANSNRQLAPNKVAKDPVIPSSEPSAVAASSSSEKQHILSPGDSISLKVFGESDLSAENVRVPQSGRVSFPLIGSVMVAGQTTTQVEVSVAKILAQGYVKNPRLSVTIFSYRPIFIRGAVENTGSFPFSEGLTISKAIALAGGTKNSAKRNGVSILREGRVIERSLDVDSQIVVDSGDVISVAEEQGVGDDEGTYVYLHGEVAAPGEYKFRRGLTVEKAIVLAGGFTLRASRKKINVTRYVDIEEDQEPERLKRVKLYTPVKPGDIIDVGASWF